MRAGAAREVPHANSPPRDKLPVDAQKMRTRAVIVITRGRPEDSPENEAARREAHRRVAATSPKGRHVIAGKSGITCRSRTLISW
jgi:hypothetical protein